MFVLTQLVLLFQDEKEGLRSVYEQNKLNQSATPQAGASFQAQKTRKLFKNDHCSVS